MFVSVIYDFTVFCLGTKGFAEITLWQCFMPSHLWGRSRIKNILFFHHLIVIRALKLSLPLGVAQVLWKPEKVGSGWWSARAGSFYQKPLCPWYMRIAQVQHLVSGLDVFPFLDTCRKLSIETKSNSVLLQLIVNRARYKTINEIRILFSFLSVKIYPHNSIIFCLGFLDI